MKYVCLAFVVLAYASAQDASFAALPNGCGPAPGGDPNGPLRLNASIPGTISSPDFNFSSPADSLYPNNVRCDWVITMDDEAQLETALTFFNFSVEDCSDCKCDSVSVWTGENQDPANLVGTYCNDPADPAYKPPELLTTGRSISVSFQSDDSGQFPGFLARYGAPFTSDACTGVVEEIHSNQGVFMSENYPVNYNNFASCEWRFIAPASQKIQIWFGDFATENCCSCDYLEVYDGADATAPYKGRFYGTMRPARMTSSGSTLYMRFSSDYSVTNTGFYGLFNHV